MDVQFINPVLKSINDVLSLMAKLDLKPGEIRRREREETVSGHCVTGLMSIIGEDATASIALTFTEPVILEIANNMLPQQKHHIDGLVIDLVGELANMVMGGAKSQLENNGHVLKMSLPTIIMGHDYLVYHKTKSPILQVPFKTRTGKFFVEASFERNKK